MKKIRLTLLMLMAFLMPLAMQAQATLEIGTGTSNGSQTPFNSLYGYSFTEQVYLASEIGTSCTITAVSFRLGAEYSTEMVHDIVLYMKNVTRETFESSTDWEEVTAADVVFDGQWTLPANTIGWVTITLATPFEYDGTSNLMIAMDENTSGYQTRNFTYTTVTNSAISAYSDSSNPDPYDLASFSGTKNLRSNRANLQLTIVPPAGFCAKPTGLTASDVTNNSVVLSWTAGNEETEWTFDVNGTPMTGITTNPYTLTGLTGETAYTVKVKANCSTTSESDWSNTVNFTTTPTPEVVGDSWSDDFETSTWSFVNGTCTNAWAIGTATNNGGSKALYISNDEGTTNAYTVTSAAMVYATKCLQFNEGVYNFSYDWNGNGESTWDYMRIALVPASVQLTAGTSVPSGFSSTALPTGWIALDGGSKLNQATEWQQKSVEKNIPAGVYFLVFAWRDDTSGGTNPPASVDNLNITAVSCPTPTGLAVADIEATSAVLSWTAGGDEEAWTVEVNGTPITGITTNPYTLTDLTPLTAYTVRVKANCTATDASFWTATVNFTTPEMPEIVGTSWSDDFETSTWNLINGSLTNAWTIGTATNNGGSKSLYVSNDGGTTNAYDNTSNTMVYATKLLQFNEGYYNFSYDWMANGESTYDYLRVALVPTSVTLTASTSTPSGFSASALPTGWIALDGGSKLNQETEWQTMIAEAELEAGSYYLVFAWRNDYSDGNNPPAAVDNINITFVTCFTPTIDSVYNITTTSASIDWTASENTPAPANGWTISLNGEETTVPAATTTYTFTDLTPATLYTVQVRANCGDDDESAWAEEMFVTDCPEAFVVTYDNPFHEGFEGGSIACWSVAQVAGTSSWNIYSGESYAHDGNQFALAPYTTGNATLLISPVLDLTQVENPILDFYYNLVPDDEDVDSLAVYYRNVDTAAWTLLADFGAATEDYTLASIELPDPTATYQISFLGVGRYGNNIFLDDITVYAVAPVEPCAVPTNVAVENNVVTWEGNAASYNVMVIVGEDTTTATVNTATYTIEGLEDGTEGTVAVQAVCAEDNISEWSEAVAFTFVGVGINNYGIQANIYPNPTTGNVTVESDAINADITVFDMFGKLMMTSKVASERTELDFNGFAPGVYMVRIANATGITTVKVVKE